MNEIVQCANTKTIFKPLTENDFDKIDGTYRQATLSIPYRILVDVFGEPLCGDGGKTDAEWIIEFADGTIATIYNYKNGITYCGDSGIPTEQITDWSIGGHCSSVVNLIESALVETMDSRHRRLLEQL